MAEANIVIEDELQEYATGKRKGEREYTNCYTHWTKSLEDNIDRNCTEKFIAKLQKLEHSHL